MGIVVEGSSRFGSWVFQSWPYSALSGPANTATRASRRQTTPPAIATLSFLRRRHAICHRERPWIALLSPRGSVGPGDLLTTSSSPPDNDTRESLLHGQSRCIRAARCLE